MTLNEQLKELGLNDHDRKVMLEILGMTEEDANKEGNVRAFICRRKDIDANTR